MKVHIINLKEIIINSIKENTIDFIGLMVAIIGLIISYYSFLIPLKQYIHQKNLEEKDRRFRAYHQLIEELVSPSNGKELKLDRQIAIVFELRNFPDYYEVTHRIITESKIIWASDNFATTHSKGRLIGEADLTIDYINKAKRKLF